MAKDTLTTFIVLTAPGLNDNRSVMINPEDISFVAEQGIRSTCIYMKNGREVIVIQSVDQINAAISTALKDLISQIIPSFVD